MRHRAGHTAAAISATALLAVTGCGADQAATAAGGATAAAQQGAPGGALPTASLKTLASKLGVSTSRLRAAMEKTRPTSGQPPSGDPTAALAKDLDLSTAKVQAAIKAAGMGGRGGAPPNGAAPPSGTAPSQDTTQS